MTIKNWESSRVRDDETVINSATDTNKAFILGGQCRDNYSTMPRRVACVRRQSVYK